MFIATTVSAQSSKVDRATKKLAYSYLMAEDPNLTFDEVLELNAFKSVENLILEAGPTYWFRVDFKNELDTLQTLEPWRLRTNYFSKATVYYKNGESIQQKPIGQINKKEANNSLIYLDGILFNPEDLISKRYLYIKVQMYFSNPNPIHFQYISNASNRFYTAYYTKKDLKRLIPSFGYFGACFILFLSFIVIFINIRNVEFLYYPLYVLFSAIYLTGLDIPVLENFLASRAGFWIGLISQVLINLFYVLFAKYYLNTKNKYPLLDLIINIAIGTLVILIISHFAVYFLDLYKLQENILDIQRTLMTFFGLFSMVYLLFKAKDKLALFIVFGSFVYMTGALGFWFSQTKYYMMVGSFLEILIFSLGLAYKIKQEYEGKVALQKEVSLKEISAKRAQINPHFFFNSLGSIQHLILNDNKTAALNYLTKFGKLARNVLESSYETTVTLTEEIELLRSYLELESLRFDNAFSYSIVVDSEIDSDSIDIPLMLIQPFAENAIIHGLIGKKEGEKHLEIRFLKEEKYYVVEVEDNGIGRRHTEPEVKKKKSRGMEITKKRLKMLDTSDKHKNTIEIIDKYDSHSQPSGTKVTIRLYNP
ncbi:histidine kinase [Muricauda sp. 334s03]|uniref:Histidine kinase n=1 Tax=Flagellimonas yonaguniensis TaxID=3031325 RepID=A0ABT5Y2N8_9FLAO|nr:histidine kinase [[Muricauda] yonaguniensis]MDF0717598.1 histidine kinase [[Muricauda] yonaguniensis]